MDGCSSLLVPLLPEVVTESGEWASRGGSGSFCSGSLSASSIGLEQCELDADDEASVGMGEITPRASSWSGRRRLVSDIFLRRIRI